MPLCPTCKSEAEYTTVGLPPSRLSRFLSELLSTPPTPSEGECSRCGRQCDECGTEY